MLKKSTELWDKIKNLIEKIDNRPDEYRKDYTKIKINSDDNLTLNKILKLHNLTIIVRPVFKKNNSYYPQIYLEQCLCEL